MNRDNGPAVAAASARAARIRAERFDALETALSAGLTVCQALDDAGWATPNAAVRSYQRFHREVPKLLWEAYLQSRRRVSA